MRPVLVLLHRYVGLATALFLFLAGLTGSLLAFHHEIDEWLNPGFYAVGEGGERLSPGSLVQRVESRYPRQLVWYMEYPEAGGHPALLSTVPREAGAKVEHDVFYLDPVSGEEVGKRLWAACCFQPANLVPWVLEFHHNLTLPGNWGLYLMGGVAMFWFLDCFVGAWLTLPRGRPFWSKWATAWKIKRGNAYRFNFDLHRAGGLWLWLLLAPVALSSVALNLPSQVFKPLVSLFSPIEPSVYEARGRLPREQLGETRLDYDRTFQLASVEAARLGIAEPIGELYYSFEYNFFGAGFGDHDDPMGKSWLFFHGSDGRLLGQEVAGQGSWGERFYRLQYPIHGGRIAGLPGRIAIAALGLAIAGLSLTGVYIWWRKRRARHWNGR
ncbi:PepSY domain-containing protein [Pseudomonas aeruginosa]|nr:PepSY domain-containing protein [Pseudomonas aeruginosa]